MNMKYTYRFLLLSLVIALADLLENKFCMSIDWMNKRQ
jgi:hypothetical protein